MLKRSLFGLAIIAAAGAQAQLIDFENLPNSDPNFTLQGDSVISGGFKFASTTHVGEMDSVASWGSGMSLYTGSVAIFANYIDDSMLMTKVGGGAFNVTSIGMADVFLAAGPWTVTLIGTRADTSTVTETVNVTTGNVLTNYSLSNMTNIVSMKIDDTANTSMQLDNIATTAVPEPASMAVLGLGVAAVLRRRRR